MSFHSRSSIQQPLKISQKLNKPQNPNSSYLKNFKKPTVGNNLNISQNQKQRFSIDSNSRCKTPQMKKSNPPKQKIDPKKYDSIQSYIKQTDNSMQEILNSSINQFQKLMSQGLHSQELQQQNSRLKTTLSKMKNILKDKLQIALKRQKQQLSKMLQDYIQLITKLLRDKQELTTKIQQLTNQSRRKLRELDYQWSQKYEQVIRDKQDYIQKTKQQVNQFLQVIQQYQQEAKMESTRLNDMKQKIEQLQREKQEVQRKLDDKNLDSNMANTNESNLLLKIQAQSAKIQTLLELLQNSQIQNSDLKSQISRIKSRQTSRVTAPSDLKEQYQKIITQIYQQHQQQFLQYQKAIRDTIVKKDECIQRLNIIIEGLRQRKSNADNYF